MLICSKSLLVPRGVGTLAARSVYAHQEAPKKPAVERPKRREKPVPASQLSRLTSFGGVAIDIGARVFSRSVKETIMGGDEASKKRSSLLTTEEVNKIVELLCKVRGAALKVGQILSLQDDSVMNPQLRQVFERARDSADCMPFWQAQKVLSTELGSDWERKFATFDKEPFAAASIGQVHRATLHDGREVAVKVQYPGVEQSIDSDLKNLLGLIKVWDIMPKGVYIENLMRVLRRELLWEVNYIREAKCAKHFKELIAASPELSIVHVPDIIDDLSSRRVITVDFVKGVPVDKMVKDKTLRNKVGSALMQLYNNEVFVYRFMQTDPNFSNFIFNPETAQVQLLDFGAARSFGKPFIDAYIRIIMAAAEGNRHKVLERSREIGFLTGYESKRMEDAHCESVMALGEALRAENYDFGQQDATKKVVRLIPVMSKERLTPPPDETYSLHRKFAGIFMLLTQLGSVVPVRSQFLKIVENYKFDAVQYTMSTMPVDDGNTGIKL